METWKDTRIMSGQIEEQAELNEQILMILADYSNDLHGIKMRDGKLPAIAALDRIKALKSEQKEDWEKELLSWIENKAPITLVENIGPLENGQYVKVKNLVAHLSQKEEGVKK